MRRWRSWSLRRRVLVASSLAVTAVVVLGVVAFGVSLDRILYGAALDAARLRVTQVADRLASGEVTAAAALQDVPVQGSLLQVLGADGQVVAASEQSHGRTAFTDLRPAAGAVVVTQQVEIPGELGEPYAVVAQGVQAADGGVYVVVVATPLSIENTTVTSATTLLAVGAAVLLALLLILINRILEQALEPVERIRSEVARITQVRDGEPSPCLPPATRSPGSPRR